jgi:hypothetical protein
MLARGHADNGERAAALAAGHVPRRREIFKVVLADTLRVLSKGRAQRVSALALPFGNSTSTRLLRKASKSRRILRRR